MRITLTDKAQSDLDAIHEHYESQIGSERATDAIVRMLEALERLELFPGSGRPSQVPDVRDLVFPHHPFIAPYRVYQDEIQVLRILHQRAERTEDW